MNLIKQLKADMITAMKSKETEKLSTLRLLIAEMEKEKVSFKLLTADMSVISAIAKEST